MPDIKLGPSGSETTLPDINWMGGEGPDLPVGCAKQVERATMLDGSSRYNFKSYSPKTFSLEWAWLTQAQVLTLQGLADLNQRLRYQNNWADALWRFVVVVGFEYSPIQTQFASTARYRAMMELEECP